MTQKLRNITLTAPTDTDQTPLQFFTDRLARLNTELALHQLADPLKDLDHAAYMLFLQDHIVYAKHNIQLLQEQGQDLDQPHSA